MEASEQRRIAMMRSCGIDPATGLKIGNPPPPPTATSTLPDGGPLPAGRNESPEEYARRFEQQRRFQLEQLARRVAERKAQEGGK